MKKLILLILFLSPFIFIQAQQLFLSTGKSISSFNYKNSQGNELENLQSTNNTFINLGYRKSIFTKNLLLSLSGVYNSYGAVGSDQELDNYFKWDLNYIGLSAGLDFDFFKPGKFTFYLKGAASIEFLIQGTQTINSQVYNLKDQKDFNSPAYFFRGGLGVLYKASDIISVFTDYMYGIGNYFQMPQGNLKISQQGFGIGIFVNIAKKSSPSPAINFVNPVYDSTINELQKRLEKNAQEIKELQANEQEAENLRRQLAEKEKEITSIKESIAHALQPYNGNELTINQVAGKVYITLGNDMLFKSGSAKLSPEGIKAIDDLGKVLQEKNNLDILIEGHTDNQPFKNSNMNNWDLSVQRATAVVDILTKNKNIDTKTLTAAGKGEQDPIADNSTEEGRKKNRRIVVVISPELNKLSELIKN